MEVEPLIQLNNNKCTNCYSCIRVCPVKAIQVRYGNKHPIIKQERCIQCGSCIEICQPQAITYRSSIDEAKELLESSNTKVAILSPSISAEFEDITDYRKFVQMIRALGIQHVNEVSFGVDLIAYKYNELFSAYKGKYYITSTDPVIVSYIEKFHPNLINNLAPLVSPKIAMTKVVRKLYGDNIKVLYIGPDVASKDEVRMYEKDGRIDVAITFIELRELFRDFDIDESTLEFSEFDPPLGYKGSLYPLRNGLLQAAEMDENLLTTHIFCVQGKRAMIEAIAEFEKSVKIIKRHIHVTYGNWLIGPGTTNRGNTFLREHHIIKYANKRLRNFFRHEWHNELMEYSSLDLSRTFKENDQRLPAPSKEKIDDVLKLLGRKVTDRYGCEECGYASCNDFAVAIAQGLATPEMCSTYALRHSIDSSVETKEIRDRLQMIQIELEQTREDALHEKQLAEQASELNDFIFDKLRAGVVLVDQNLKIIKANNSFTRILGDDAKEINDVIPGLVGADLKKLLPLNLTNLFQYVLDDAQFIDGKDMTLGEALINVSIFPVRKNKIAGGIIRDMRAPEVQKAEVVNRISEVIDKNLEMVQKIGFLLGEGASDVEKMLNSIVEFYKSGNENK
ncbi:MAG: 4Fe-4S binding protein [Bacteroidales bacterium]|nr:4Fe-4S binding protein [Bacteroidales bacterium]